MSTLSLHVSIYSADAIDRAVQVFSDYGRFEVTAAAGGDYIQVSITSNDPVDEAELSGEFANYALVDSIDSAPATPTSPSTT